MFDMLNASIKHERNETICQLYNNDMTLLDELEDKTLCHYALDDYYFNKYAIIMLITTLWTSIKKTLKISKGGNQNP